MEIESLLTINDSVSKTVSSIPIQRVVSTKTVFCYFCQVGYVFIDICLFVSRTTQKLLIQFAQNLVERWRHGNRRTR